MRKPCNSCNDPNGLTSSMDAVCRQCCAWVRRAIQASHRGRVDELYYFLSLYSASSNK